MFVDKKKKNCVDVSCRVSCLFGCGRAVIKWFDFWGGRGAIVKWFGGVGSEDFFFFLFLLFFLYRFDSHEKC